VSGRPPTARARRNLGLALLGVAAFLAAFPPLGLWPLAFVAPGLLAELALRAPGGRSAFGRLAVVGAVLFLVGAGWLAEAHVVNLVLVTAVELLWVGAFGWAAHRVLPRAPLFPALPLLWVAHEMARLCWPSSGFPWLLLGHALAASPAFVQAADLGGVLLVSFVAACGGTALLAWRSGRGGMKPSLAVVVVALAYGFVRPATLGEPTAGPVLATIQPAFPQRLKDDPTAAEERWAVCRDLAAEAAREGPRLLVFPETMWPWPLVVAGRPGGDPVGGAVEDAVARNRDSHARPMDALLALAPDMRLLLGVVTYALTRPDGEGARPLNGALYVDEGGRWLDRYDKHVLVPGGEFLPYLELFPEAFQRWLTGTVRAMAGFVPDLLPGPGARLMELDGVPFGVTICFENAYGSYNRRFVARGARFLVNLSNEGWFGTSSEFDHMELHSVLRAVETRRALFRSTNSGISGLVRPDGRRPEGADRLERGGADRAVRGVFARAVPLHDDVSLYVLWGDWVGWVGVVGAGVLLLRGRARVS